MLTGDEELNRACHPWLAADEAMSFKGLKHVVDARRRGAKETLEIALGGGLAMDCGVGVDERQVLALQVCPLNGVMSCRGRRLERGNSTEFMQRTLPHEYTISCDPERGRTHPTASFAQWRLLLRTGSQTRAEFVGRGRGRDRGADCQDGTQQSGDDLPHQAQFR